jgi:hypothetical protein
MSTVTVEGIVRFADDPAGREGLVRSIAQQESPLVQLALADVMVGPCKKKGRGAVAANSSAGRAPTST